MFAPARTPPHLATLIVLTAVSVLSLNMFLPSLPGIAAEFDADYALVSLSISGYLAVTAILQIVLGPLSDRYGRRPILLISALVFAVASLVCALAQEFWIFLTFRILQGAIIAGSAIASAVIRDTTDEKGAASLIGYVGMAMAVAPMLAPMLGGALDALFGWRANFWVYCLAGLGLIVVIWADLGETNVTRSSTLSEQIKAYPELLKSRRFWAYSLCMAFGIGTFFIFISGAPFVATTAFAMSSASLGFGIGTITMGFFVGSFLSGRYSTRMGLMWMIMAGRIVALAGLGLGLGLYAIGGFNAYVFFGAAICVGIGNGLSTPSARVGALSVRPNLAGSASGLSGALIVGTGAVLSLIPGTVLTAENGAWGLMTLMVATSVLGLASAIYVQLLDQRERRALGDP